MFEFLEEWFQPIGERIEKLEQTVKGVQQNLTEIINLGPTITQKKMWLDEFFGLTNEETILVLNKLRKLK